MRYFVHTKAQQQEYFCFIRVETKSTVSQSLDRINGLHMINILPKWLINSGSMGY